MSLTGVDIPGTAREARDVANVVQGKRSAVFQWYRRQAKREGRVLIRVSSWQVGNTVYRRVTTDVIRRDKTVKSDRKTMLYEKSVGPGKWSVKELPRPYHTLEPSVFADPENMDLLTHGHVLPAYDTVPMTPLQLWLRDDKNTFVPPPELELCRGEEFQFRFVGACPDSAFKHFVMFMYACIKHGITLRDVNYARSRWPVAIVNRLLKLFDPLSTQYKFLSIWKYYFETEDFRQTYQHWRRLLFSERAPMERVTADNRVMLSICLKLLPRKIGGSVNMIRKVLGWLDDNYPQRREPQCLVPRGFKYDIALHHVTRPGSIEDYVIRTTIPEFFSARPCAYINRDQTDAERASGVYALEAIGVIVKIDSPLPWRLGWNPDLEGKFEGFKWKTYPPTNGEQTFRFGFEKGGGCFAYAQIPCGLSLDEYSEIHYISEPQVLFNWHCEMRNTNMLYRKFEPCTLRCKTCGITVSPIDNIASSLYLRPIVKLTHADVFSPNQRNIIRMLTPHIGHNLKYDGVQFQARRYPLVGESLYEYIQRSRLDRKGFIYKKEPAWAYCMQCNSQFVLGGFDLKGPTPIFRTARTHCGHPVSFMDRPGVHILAVANNWIAAKTISLLGGSRGCGLHSYYANRMRSPNTGARSQRPLMWVSELDYPRKSRGGDFPPSAFHDWEGYIASLMHVEFDVQFTNVLRCVSKRLSRVPY
jgi:hypothetical protein